MRALSHCRKGQLGTILRKALSKLRVGDEFALLGKLIGLLPCTTLEMLILHDVARILRRSSTGSNGSIVRAVRPVQPIQILGKQTCTE